MTEYVLVFSNWQLEHLPSLPGFSQDKSDIYKFREGIVPSARFVERERVETSDYYKQIIPYVIVQDVIDKKILAYRRTTKSTEDRLHDKWSIGFGGHVNIQDVKGNEHPSYINAMRRELKEEIGLEGGKHSIIGLLYDPSNEVGKVHFGVVVAYGVINKNISSAEAAIDKDLKWVSIEEAQKLPNLENWSQLILEKLNE